MAICTQGKAPIATLGDLIGFEDDKTGYVGMPPYYQPQLDALYTIEIQLETEEDVKEFVNIVGEDYDTLLESGLRSVKSYWYPALEKGERGSNGQYIWVEEDDNVQ